jgi:hypothetical protein
MPVIFVLGTGGLFPRTSRAQSLPAKKEAAEMLAKAEEQTKLSSSGTPPFHLIAALQYKAGHFSAVGTYEVLWAAPDRFRQELRLGEISESDVIVNGKEFVARSTPSAAYLLDRIDDLIGFSTRTDKPRIEKIGKVYPEQEGTEKLVCVQTSGSAKGHTACLDAGTGRLVSDTRVSQRNDFNPKFEESEFLDYDSIRFPGKFSFEVEDERIEIEVKKLNKVTSFADDVFASPPGATTFVWCEQPRMEGGADPGQGLMTMLSLFGRTKGFHAFYFKVAADGSIEAVDEVHRDGKFRPWLVPALDQQRLSVRTCGGKAIEYEAIPFAWVPITAY